MRSLCAAPARTPRTATGAARATARYDTVPRRSPYFTCTRTAAPLVSARCVRPGRYVLVKGGASPKTLITRYVGHICSTGGLTRGSLPSAVLLIDGRSCLLIAKPEPHPRKILCALCVAQVLVQAAAFRLEQAVVRARVKRGPVRATPLERVAQLRAPCVRATDAMGFMTRRASSAGRVAPNATRLPDGPAMSTWADDYVTYCDEAEQRTEAMLHAAAQELRMQFPMEQAKELWGLVDKAVEAVEDVQPGLHAKARAEAKLKAAVSAAMSAVSSATTYMRNARRVTEIDFPNELAMAVKKAKQEEKIESQAAIERERNKMQSEKQQACREASLAARQEAEREAEAFLNQRITDTQKKAAAKLSKTVQIERENAVKHEQEAVSAKEQQKEEEKIRALRHAHDEMEKDRTRMNEEKRIVVETASEGFNALQSDLEGVSQAADAAMNAVKAQHIEALEVREREMAQALVEFETATEKAKVEAQEAKEQAVAAAIAETRDAVMLEQQKIREEEIAAAEAESEKALFAALADTKAEAAAAAAEAAKEAADALKAALEKAANESAEAQAVALNEAKEAMEKEHAQALLDAIAKAREEGRLEGVEATKAIYANTHTTTEEAMKNSVQIAVEVAVAGHKMQMDLEHKKALAAQQELHEAAMAEAAAALAKSNEAWQARLDAEMQEREDEVEACHELTRSWVDAHAAVEAARVETVAMLDAARKELATIKVRELWSIRVGEMKERWREKSKRSKSNRSLRNQKTLGVGIGAATPADEERDSSVAGQRLRQRVEMIMRQAENAENHLLLLPDTSDGAIPPSVLQRAVEQDRQDQLLEEQEEQEDELEAELRPRPPLPPPRKEKRSWRKKKAPSAEDEEQMRVEAEREAARRRMEGFLELLKKPENADNEQRPEENAKDKARRLWGRSKSKLKASRSTVDR